MISIQHILAWWKSSPKYILPAFVLTAIILFAPVRTLNKFGVDELVAKYRMWVGLILLSSLSLLISHFAFWLADKIQTWRIRHRKRSARRALLRDLTPKERVLLARFIADNTKSKPLNRWSGIVVGLCHGDIIYRSSSTGSFNADCYNIQPWAWKELRENPRLLEPELSKIRKGDMSTDGGESM